MSYLHSLSYFERLPKLFRRLHCTTGSFVQYAG